jgi:hypothetical protein
MKKRYLPVPFFVRYIITILFTAFVMVACKPALQGLSMSERIAISDSIRVTLQNYVADIGREGYLAEFRYLDSSENFYWVPPGRRSAISYDSVARILRAAAPLYQKVSIRWDSLAIHPLTAALGSYSGKLHSLVVSQKGDTAEFDLVETGIVIRRKSGWKLLSGHTSVVVER